MCRNLFLGFIYFGLCKPTQNGCLGTPWSNPVAPPDARTVWNWGEDNKTAIHFHLAPSQHKIPTTTPLWSSWPMASRCACGTKLWFHVLLRCWEKAPDRYSSPYDGLPFVFEEAVNMKHANYWSISLFCRQQPHQLMLADGGHPACHPSKGHSAMNRSACETPDWRFIVGSR